MALKTLNPLRTVEQPPKTLNCKVIVNNNNRRLVTLKLKLLNCKVTCLKGLTS